MVDKQNLQMHYAEQKSGAKATEKLVATEKVNFVMWIRFGGGLIYHNTVSNFKRVTEMIALGALFLTKSTQ